MNSIDDKAARAARATTNGEVQSVLYKFRDPSEWTVSILEKCELWFAAPSTFNDPFDCSLSETNHHSSADVQAFFQHLITGKSPREVATLPKPTAALLKPIVEKAKQTVMDKAGVLSLSRKVDDILMWSHYASNHAGLALEFDVRLDPHCFDGLVNMNYVDTYAPTNYFAEQQSSMVRVITTKSKHWAYEEEVRIMKHDKNGLVAFRPESLRRIFFGCKADPAFIDRIRNICKAPHLAHVRFVKMEKAYGAFAVDQLPMP
jgi:hypothetical protein